MKTLKQLLVLTAALCAISAQASPSLNVNMVNGTIGTALNLNIGSTAHFSGTVADSSTPSPLTQYFSAPNTAAISFLNEFRYSSNGGSTWSGYSGFGVSPTVTGIANGAAITTTPTALVVNWTPPLTGFATGLYEINTHFQADLSGTTITTYLNLQAAPVPEPAQTIAGAMLLGVGGLVFVSRRMLKKQA